MKRFSGSVSVISYGKPNPLISKRQGGLLPGRDGHCWPPPGQIRTCPIKASGSYRRYLTTRNLSRRRVARGPVPVTRFPGPVPGTCFAGPRSPRSPPFAPPAPPPVARLCSLASSLLWRSQTHMGAFPSSDVISFFELQLAIVASRFEPCFRPGGFPTSSNSHTVAVFCNGCTKIPISSGKGSGGRDPSSHRRLRPYLTSVRPAWIFRD